MNTVQMVDRLARMVAVRTSLGLVGCEGITFVNFENGEWCRTEIAPVIVEGQPYIEELGKKKAELLSMLTGNSLEGFKYQRGLAMYEICRCGPDEWYVMRTGPVSDEDWLGEP